MAKANVDNTATLGFEAKLWHAAESEARSAKRGLWQDTKPINPHDFRKTKRTK